jgi:hypothetical protein
MLQEPGNNVVAMGIDLTEFYLRHQRLEIELNKPTEIGNINRHPAGNMKI